MQVELCCDPEVDVVANLCRLSFVDFVQEFWECIPGVGKLVWNWHIGVFARELQEVAERVFKGLPRTHDPIFNVPFGTSKSTVISVMFQAWVWTCMPEARFICATHTDSLARDLSDRCRGLVKSEKYQECFPTVLVRLDKDSKEDWGNTAGGERKNCTVGGKTPMGRHAHFIIVDDPIDPQGVRSEAELETAKRFVTEVIPSRMVDKAVTPTILVMQRLHPRDPTAVLLEVGKAEGSVPVRLISFPGEISDGASEVLPPEYRKLYIDGLMDPVRMPKSVLKGYEVRMGRFAYSGQVLQNPVPPGGGMFKPGFFEKRERAAPYDAMRVLGIDRAATADGGCATAMVLMAKGKDGRLWVEHVVRGQWDPDERNDRIVAESRRCRSRYGPNHEPTIVVEMERGSTGLESFQGLARRLLGYKVREERPTGSKDVRAEPWADQLAAGNVILVEDGSWSVQDFVDEHLMFRPDPNTKRLGAWKDQVDAASMSCSWLAKFGEGKVDLRIYTLGTRKDAKHPRIVVCSEEILPQVELEDRCLLVVIRNPLIVTKEVMCNGGPDAVQSMRADEPSRPELSLSEKVEENIDGRRGNGTNPTAPPGIVPDVNASSPAPLKILGKAGSFSSSLPAGGRPAAIHESGRGDPPPLHSLQHLADPPLVLRFADLDPGELQESWDKPVEPWGELPAELIITREDGKKLWQLLTKKRDPGWLALVIADQGESDRRAASIAMAVSEMMRLPKGSIHDPRDPERRWEKAPNMHLYDSIKSLRSTVI